MERRSAVDELDALFIELATLAIEDDKSALRGAVIALRARGLTEDEIRMIVRDALDNDDTTKENNK